jgi:uncharacterized RDD family membrane protein YckC
MMSAVQAQQTAPEPRLEKGPLPKVEAPSDPPLSRAQMPRAEVAAEPGPSSAPPSAKGPEPAFVGEKRSMAVRSAALHEEEIHAEPGGAFAQIGAGIVDAMVLGALFLAYLFVAQAIAGKLPATDETGIDWLIDRAVTWRGVLAPGAVLLAALWFVYGSLFHALGGRTLGKRLFGLTVVDASGLPPRLVRSAGRSLLSFVSAGLLFMGFVLVVFDSRKQALHDKLARTFVVRLA